MTARMSNVMIITAKIHCQDWKDLNGNKPRVSLRRLHFPSSSSKDLLTKSHFFFRSRERGCSLQIFNPRWSTPTPTPQKPLYFSHQFHCRCRFCTGTLYFHLTDELKDQCYHICKEHIAKIPQPSERKYRTTRRKKKKIPRTNIAKTATSMLEQIYFREVDIALLRVSAGTLCLQYFSNPVCCFWHSDSLCVFRIIICGVPEITRT